MDGNAQSLQPKETFTKAPAVAFDPDAAPPDSVRARFPGEEPPAGLRIGDLGPGDESEPHIRPLEETARKEAQVPEGPRRDDDVEDEVLFAPVGGHQPNLSSRAATAS